MFLLSDSHFERASLIRSHLQLQSPTKPSTSSSSCSTSTTPLHSVVGSAAAAAATTPSSSDTPSPSSVRTRTVTLPLGSRALDRHPAFHVVEDLTAGNGGGATVPSSITPAPFSGDPSVSVTLRLQLVMSSTALHRLFTVIAELEAVPGAGASPAQDDVSRYGNSDLCFLSALCRCRPMMCFSGLC